MRIIFTNIRVKVKTKKADYKLEELVRTGDILSRFSRTVTTDHEFYL